MITSYSSTTLGAGEESGQKGGRKKRRTRKQKGGTPDPLQQYLQQYVPGSEGNLVWRRPDEEEEEAKVRIIGILATGKLVKRCKRQGVPTDDKIFVR